MFFRSFLICHRAKQEIKQTYRATRKETGWIKCVCVCLRTCVCGGHQLIYLRCDACVVFAALICRSTAIEAVCRCVRLLSYFTDHKWSIKFNDLHDI